MSNILKNQSLKIQYTMPTGGEAIGLFSNGVHFLGLFETKKTDIANNDEQIFSLQIEREQNPEKWLWNGKNWFKIV